MSGRNKRGHGEISQSESEDGGESSGGEHVERKRRGEEGKVLPIVNEDHMLPDEEGSGDELDDDNLLAQDYRAIPELDHYEMDDLDSQEYSEEAIDFEERKRLEREMHMRDAQERRRNERLPAYLRGDDEEEEEEVQRRRRRIGDDDELLDSEDDDQEFDDEDAPDNRAYVNLEDYKGPLREYLAMDGPRAEIKRRFRHFLSHYTTTQGEYLYAKIISAMCSDNRQNLEVSYRHLSQTVPILAVWVADEPSTMLELFDEEAMTVALSMFPNYAKIHREVHVRLTELPVVDSLRALRQQHLNALVKVEGVVTRRTNIFPQLKLVKFNCGKCRAVIGPYVQNTTGEIMVSKCPMCQGTGPFSVNMQETVFQNYQKITLQESPGSVPAGRVPRQKDVILLQDLIDGVSPGEEVEITGIYQHTYDTSLNIQHGFPVFSTVIRANYIQKKHDLLSKFRLTDEDQRKIVELSRRPNIVEMIVNSIAPSIYGHRTSKMALALAMFGGVAKEFENKHRIRGDINVLLMGDPGTAKSQFLKFVEKTSHRAVYTTGKGASAVGLTASVRKDALTREWTLEGGALVLADNGICMIDEFDKMNDKDRTSIHEAMEQQSISISKAGIICTLKARCAVIAAANPIGGRYNSSATFADNVELTDAIISRFDILCVVRDTVDRAVDTKLASFVVGSHVKAHPNYDEDDPAERWDSENQLHERNVARLDQDMLKKYLVYAKQTCRPQLANIDSNKVATLFKDLRKESSVSDGIPIAVRHMESIIRMSEAHAKMHLRESVTEEDVNVAIRVMLETFIGTQKYSVKTSLEKHFSKYITYAQDHHELLLYRLQEMVQSAINLGTINRRLHPDRNSSFSLSTPVEIAIDDFRKSAHDLQISRLDSFFNSRLFSSNGFTVDERRGKIIKNFNY